MTQPTAPTDLILGFLTHHQPHDPWVPVAGDGPWFTTATFGALLTAGRLVVHRYADVVHATLDGQPVSFVHSLYGIVGRNCPELTV